MLALQERRHAEKVADVHRRGRLAHLDEAEAQSRRSQDRGLTGEELEQVIERLPQGL